MRRLLTVCCVVTLGWPGLAGCRGGGSNQAAVDGGASDSGAGDAGGTNTGFGAECAPTVIAGASPVSGPCVESGTTSAQGTPIDAMRVKVDCTDPNITAMPEKRHLVMLPNGTPRGVLWLHLGGTGGEPGNTSHIGLTAAIAGYHFISLAYPNQESVQSRCWCAQGPRPAGCEERVRREIIYGVAMTDWVDVEADEAIIPRAIALLDYLSQQAPEGGWGAFLTADKTSLNWSAIALSGFSQGGMHAGMIARDHEVVRVMYLSTSVGSTLNVIVDPSAATACSSHDECDVGRCCPLSDHECEAPSGDSYCLILAPTLGAFVGKDVDGDGLGDGDSQSRATPATRSFGLIHRDEPGWQFSPDVWERWGMGLVVDADTSEPPYGGAQVFSTGVPPKPGNCSPHQSMGADSCQTLGDDGLPTMTKTWNHCMTTPVD